jgi:hypothetical protein
VALRALPPKRKRPGGRPARLPLSLLGLLTVATAARGESSPNAPLYAPLHATLGDAQRGALPLGRLLAGNQFTVIVFYGATCPCFAAHRERLQKLAADLAPRGVGFAIVDSERHAPGEPPIPEAVGPNLPVLRDEGGDLARRLGARYATESFVVDATGRVRYRGGIDSDRKVLNADTQPYLRRALASLLAGNPPALTTSKVLGCALRML